MDDLRSVRLRLESLEDRLAPSVAPTFNDLSVPDSASYNTTKTQATTPVVGVAGDNSFDVVWAATTASTGVSNIYVRQFNSDGTAKAAAFSIASSTLGVSQPAIAVMSSGDFVIAYTKALSSSQNDVFFQIYAANGTNLLGETAAPANNNPGTPNDFSPAVAASNSTGQFIIAWVQQSSATNSTIWAQMFSSNGVAMSSGDNAVATTAGEATQPQVAIEQVANSAITQSFGSVISYTLNAGNGIQKVYFRRYYLGLSAIDTGSVGVPVSGTAISDLEDDSAIAIDANGNLDIAWSSTPTSSSPSQILYQQFTSDNSPTFTFFQQFDTQVDPMLPTSGYVDSNADVNQTSPTLAVNSDGSFVVAYVDTPLNAGSTGQTYFHEISSTLQPVGDSTPYSSEPNPINAAPQIASAGNNFYALVVENTTASSIPNPIVRGLQIVTDRVGVVRPTSAGLAQFSLDSNGDNTFDTGDAVFTFGYYTDQFVIGDWNGAGYDELGVVRPYENVASIWSLDTNGDGVFDSGDQVFIYGLASDQFVIGDWNGAGKDEIGVVRQDSGALEWVLNTSGSGLYSPGSSVVDFYGGATNTPVVGDWTGSGKTDIGVVQQTASGQLQWVLNTSGTGTYSSSDAVYTFGSAGDTPIVGDWTGSGKTEIGVVVPQSNGTSTVILDTNGDGVMDAGDTSFTFGLSTDKFIVGKWTPTAQAEFAALPGPGGAAPLTNAQLAATVQLAIHDWAIAGLDAQQLNQLEQVQFRISQLPNNLLGLTEGSTIDIDSTADGWGWNLGIGKPASNQMDLLTTVSHELGHVLGLGDTSDLNDVMGQTLSPGTRHLPTALDVDAVFAEMGTSHS